MRDYAELSKQLRHCPAGNPSICQLNYELEEGGFCKGCEIKFEAADAIEELLKRPVIPETGIGDLSDGYHTFNGLYYQRMILFAALVRTYKDRAWKSFHHEDGELCFGGGWFIVGIDTPEGSYTYHYENKDFDRFDCVELPRGKHWDGHAEDDVVRLLSLPAPPKWISVEERLPEVEQSVLICAFGRSVGEGTYRGHNGFHHVWKMDAVAGTYWDDEVTHWMPLPSAPKESP